MAETRNPSLDDQLDHATTEQLLWLNRKVKDKLRLRTEKDETKNQLQEFSFLAATKDTSQPSAEEKKLATELLAYVDKSDYDNVEKMWKLKPDLMFIEVSGKDGVLTTPLKRALYNIDTWTWKPFYEWIRQNKPALELKFLQQNDAQKEHVDLNYLQPLSDEYAVYDTQLRKWLLKEISDAEIDREWRKLCKMQRERLPFHMIREMCREGDGLWSPEYMFDAKTAPKDGGMMVYAVGSYIKLDSDEFLDHFGSSLGLVRGTSERSALAARQAGRLLDLYAYGYLRDGDSIRQLCKVRTSDLASIPTLAQAEEKLSTLRK